MFLTGQRLFFLNGQGTPQFLTVVAYSDRTGVVPSGVLDGDLLVAISWTSSFDPHPSPAAGWEMVWNSMQTPRISDAGVYSQRPVVFFKAADGTEDGYTFPDSPFNDGEFDYEGDVFIIVLRPNIGKIESLQAASMSSGEHHTNGNPSPQTIIRAGDTFPSLAWAIFTSAGGGGFSRTVSPTQNIDVFIDGVVQAFHFTGVYMAEAPANTTFDMNDEGSRNYIGASCNRLFS
jgi:hypothetical protein